jgi:hypothetical protein
LPMEIKSEIRAQWYYLSFLVSKELLKVNSYRMQQFHRTVNHLISCASCSSYSQFCGFCKWLHAKIEQKSTQIRKDTPRFFSIVDGHQL